jgi:retron-type reverse transcriptase
MKRAGNLYGAICDRDNLRLAWVKARRGKADRPDVQAFAANAAAELEALEADLRARRWNLGHYTHFTIHDPKERIITAAPFRERVLHHAVMNVCEPYFEKWQLDVSHACRKGRGLDTALAAARRHARRNGWHLKLDVRKYFDSIPHDRLLARLGRRFKDETLLELFAAILDTYETLPGRGLPIGNLTSQFFANFHLEPLDRYVQETLRVRGYVRYMDDFVLWGDSREGMKTLERQVRTFCGEELSLELKPIVLNRTAAGLGFLGYVVRPDGMKLSARAKRRFRGKIAEADRMQDGVRAQALCAFVRRADSLAWRRKILFGASDQGSNRVNRGGSWNNNARNCRSANRDNNDPGNRNNNLGLRLALLPAQEEADALH